MHHPVRIEKWPGALLAASALAVAGPVAVAAGHGRAHVPVPRLQHGTLRVRGTHASDSIALRLAAGRPGTVQVDIGDGAAVFSFDRDRIARIAVDARSGDDQVRIDQANGSFTDKIPTTIDGGAGADTLSGGSGAEILAGGSGNDTIDGNGGDDLALMGAGDDTFVWDPGDGSDRIEGQAGADTMRFNGANIAERVDLTANGARLRFSRDIAGVTMDTAGVETVDFNALGGADAVTVGDLSGTDVDSVNVDLAATPGGAVGDGARDRVTVVGTNGDDAVDVSGDANVVKVSGLAATTTIHRPEVANDQLDIETLAGADHVASGALAPGAIGLSVDGVPVP